MADLHQDDWAREQGFRIVEMEEFFDLGVEAVIAEARRVVGDGPTYLSWDMDVLDPTYAPAVSDPEADGMTIRDALKFLVGLRGLNLVGGDVVEFNPPLDPPGLGITTYHATQIFYDMLAVVADSLAQRRGAAGASALAPA
jgi:guanidinopropionase